MILYHNPRCSKSRETLALLEGEGHAPDIHRYLDDPLSEAVLRDIAKKLDVGPREMMRTKEALYKELDLRDASDDALFSAMAAHPKLIERPILVNGKKAAIGRPPESVLAIV